MKNKFNFKTKYVSLFINSNKPGSISVFMYIAFEIKFCIGICISRKFSYECYFLATFSAGKFIIVVCAELSQINSVKLFYLKGEIKIMYVVLCVVFCSTYIKNYFN